MKKLKLTLLLLALAFSVTACGNSAKKEESSAASSASVSASETASASGEESSAASSEEKKESEASASKSEESKSEEASDDDAEEESSSEDTTEPEPTASDNEVKAPDKYTVTFDPTLDLEGNKVGPEIFKEHKLTLVNIWATWCGPCRSELPELAKLSEALKAKDVAVIGICSDVMDQDMSASEVAKKLLKDANATYPNLVVNESVATVFLTGVPGFPSSILIDSEGHVVGKPVIGARNLEQFTQWVDETLKELKK